MAKQTASDQVESQTVNSSPHETPLLPAPSEAAAEHHGEGEVDLNIKPLGVFPMIALWVVFVGLLAGLFFVGYWPSARREKEIVARAMRAADARPIVSTTRPARAKSLPALELPGSTHAFQQTLLYPRANGYLKSRLVDIGDRVKAGQLLAEIDIPDVQAQLSGAKANLETANSAVAQAKDQFELAQATYNRYKDTLKQGAVSRQEADERQTAYLAAKSALEGAIGAVRADQAEISRLETLVGFSKIFAPFDGVVASRNYDVGALLSSTATGPGNEMFRIAQTDVLRVQVDVPQAYISQIKVGAPAAFILRNYPNHPFPGKIARSSDAVDPSTRTVRIEADFENPDALLLPGMYGQCQLSLAVQQTPLVVPTSALVFSSAGMRVATVGSDNKLAFVNVTLGRDYGTEVEILNGLTGSESVVTNPGERLEAGLAVKRIGDTEPPIQKSALATRVAEINRTNAQAER